MKHHGNLIITKENQDQYNALTEVTGGVYVQKGARLTANALTKTGGVDVREGARLTANALTEVTGWVDVQKGARLTANALTTVLKDVIVAKDGKIIWSDSPKRKIGGRLIYTPSESEQKELLEKVAQAALARPEALEQSTWHTCKTTHCIAGWAITLSPDGGTLESAFGPERAGRYLLGEEASQYFQADNFKARQFLKSKLPV